MAYGDLVKVYNKAAEHWLSAPGSPAAVPFLTTTDTLRIILLKSSYIVDSTHESWAAFSSHEVGASAGYTSGTDSDGNQPAGGIAIDADTIQFSRWFYDGTMLEALQFSGGLDTAGNWSDVTVDTPALTLDDAVRYALLGVCLGANVFYPLALYDLNLTVPDGAVLSFRMKQFLTLHNDRYMRFYNALFWHWRTV